MVCFDLSQMEEKCNVFGMKMLAVTGAVLQALQSCHAFWDDGTQ